MKRGTSSSSVYLIFAPLTAEAKTKEETLKLHIENAFNSFGEWEFDDIFPWTRCDLPISMPSAFAKGENGCLAVSDGAFQHPLHQVVTGHFHRLQQICTEYGFNMTVVNMVN